MYEKVNPAHPDKVADRIAGAIVDMAYSAADRPRIAVEVLIGHEECHIIVETSVRLSNSDIFAVVNRIGGKSIKKVTIKQVEQDVHLAGNQEPGLRCGDNGIFRGMPTTDEQKMLSGIVRTFYENNPADGKYIINGSRITACQSNAAADDIRDELKFRWDIDDAVVNPLGDWTGGTDVDTGATNRKLGSDMGDAVTGGGLHGKDLSKADVSVNIYAHIKAQETGRPVELCCAIGDDMIDGQPYSAIVEIAKNYIDKLGGFEKLAEWGLI